MIHFIQIWALTFDSSKLKKTKKQKLVFQCSIETSNYTDSSNLLRSFVQSSASNASSIELKYRLRYFNDHKSKRNDKIYYNGYCDCVLCADNQFDMISYVRLFWWSSLEKYKYFVKHSTRIGISSLCCMHEINGNSSILFFYQFDRD